MLDIYSYNRALLKGLFVFTLLSCTNLVFSQPVINSFSPASGAIGTTVTITGSDFNVNGKISIFRNTTVSGAPFSASSLAPKVDYLNGANLYELM